MVADNLHFNVRAKLAIGARFADAVPVRLANYSADLVPANAQSPVVQGWPEPAPNATNGQTVAGLSPDLGFANNAWLIDDASATARVYYYTRRFSSNQYSWADGLGRKLTASSRLVKNYAGDSAWFMQYGDSVNRWALWAHLDDTNRLLLSWDRDSTTLTTSGVVVQANHDANYHEFVVEQTGGTRTAIVLFDSQPVGELLPVAVTSNMPQGVHWGTLSSNGMVKSHWQRADFALGNFSVSSAGLDVSNRFELWYSSRTNPTHGVFCPTNFLDWPALSTNVAGNGKEVSFADTNALRSIAPMLYRIRVNP